MLQCCILWTILLRAPLFHFWRAVTTEVQTLEHDGTVSEYTYHGQCKYVGKADKGLTNIASGYLNAVINIWCIPVKSMCVEGGGAVELCACRI